MERTVETQSLRASEVDRFRQELEERNRKARMLDEALQERPEEMAPSVVAAEVGTPVEEPVGLSPTPEPSLWWGKETIGNLRGTEEQAMPLLSLWWARPMGGQVDSFEWPFCHRILELNPYSARRQRLCCLECCRAHVR
ncbi:uncharacterized protein A4U43_C08F10560 [Asparagus officinalis]|nr:uncharacterized protein A4U43_C08F10560 [Asparagus officinalis]